MVALVNLFGRSPFAPLKSHMVLVSLCVQKLNDLFDALEKKDFDALQEISNSICTEEHAADLIKNDIENHLPKSLFLPIDRSHLLAILDLQDEIADCAEDIAVLTTLKNLEITESLKLSLRPFLVKNIQAFEGAALIIYEMHQLLESSFGGKEAEKVRLMVDRVAAKEHEVDVFQQKLLKDLFQVGDSMGYTTFYLWLKIFGAIAAISNLSKKLASRVRMTLELK